MEKLVAGAGVSKAGRTDLYGLSTYSQVIKHVFDRLDASQPKNWLLDSLLRFPNELQSNGFNRRTRQAPGWISQAGLSGAEIDGHGGIRVCHGQGIPAGFLGGPGDKSNVRNKRGKFDPKGPLRGGLPEGPRHLGNPGRGRSQTHARPFVLWGVDVWVHIRAEPL